MSARMRVGVREQHRDDLRPEQLWKLRATFRAGVTVRTCVAGTRRNTEQVSKVAENAWRPELFKISKMKKNSYIMTIVVAILVFEGYTGVKVLKRS